MLFLYLVLSLDKTIEGINSIMPIVSYRNSYKRNLSVNAYLYANFRVKLRSLVQK